MTKNKITLITWLYKRPELSRKVLEYYCRFPFVEIIAVGTESEQVCEGLNVSYHEMPNFPLGAKWNKAFELTRNIETDYVIVIGSDDYLCEKTLEFYFNEADLTYYRFTDLFVCDESLTKAYYISNVINCGAGFLFKKLLLEKCDYRPVPDKIQKGLDRNMFDTLLKNESGQDVSTASNQFILVDVKSNTSMNPLEAFDFRGYPVNPSYIEPILFP